MRAGPLFSRPRTTIAAPTAPVRAQVSPRKPGRRSPAQQRARITVDAIVEAAGQLLVERGRAGVTTNAVAERAGVSIGSLYQYFADKEAIFQALQRRHRDQVMPLIEHALARLTDPSLDLVDGIVMLMRAMLELHDGSPARMRALARELHEGTTPEELDAFVEHTTSMLAARTGRPPERLRATSWLACLTLGHVGRALVHDPPDLSRKDLFDALTCMLRGLFAPWRRRRNG